MSQLIKSGSSPKDGALSYKKPVVLQIIELAAKEIAGVASLSSTGAVSSLGKRSKRGIVISYLEDGLVIDLFINILFGYAVNDVSFRIQENIKRSVESMTEFKVKQVNIHVSGVLFENNEGKIIT